MHVGSGVEPSIKSLHYFPPNYGGIACCAVDLNEEIEPTPCRGYNHACVATTRLASLYMYVCIYKYHKFKVQ